VSSNESRGRLIVTIIALNRQFVVWSERKAPPTDLQFRYGAGVGWLSWEHLLAKLRIVVLAEAGSGKTAEMEERFRLLAGAGNFAFNATVEDVGRSGLDSALRAKVRERLAAWRASNEDAWFFVDSVDEAKLNDVRLEKALRQLADEIATAERRAHIVLSSRYTDWEFRKDFERFKDLLPIPEDQVASLAPTPDELLISAIRHERRKEEPPTAEEPMVVVMAPLDAERVRTFAEAKRVANLEAFMGQIANGDLWRFAGRPLDLSWLVEFWQHHRRLGTLAEMVESSLGERIQEKNTSRVRRDGVEATEAFNAL
jgi:hypothetical protein